MTKIMDCDQVADDHLADRYAMGQLSADEAEAFEDHYMLCETCVAEVERAELRVRGFKRIGAEAVEPDVASPAAAHVPAASEDALTTNVHPGVFGRMVRSPGPWMAAAALVIGAIALPYIAPTGIDGGGVSAGGRLAVFHLQAERSSDFETGHRIRIPADPKPVVLALELDPPLYGAYRATLNRGDEQLWRGDGLTVGERDTLHLGVDSSLLAVGDHQLLLEGDLDGRWVEVTRFAFRAIKDR